MLSWSQPVLCFSWQERLTEAHQVNIHPVHFLTDHLLFAFLSQPPHIPRCYSYFIISDFVFDIFVCHRLNNNSLFHLSSTEVLFECSLMQLRRKAYRLSVSKVPVSPSEVVSPQILESLPFIIYHTSSWSRPSKGRFSSNTASLFILLPGKTMSFVCRSLKTVYQSCISRLYQTLPRGRHLGGCSWICGPNFDVTGRRAVCVC